MTRAVARRIATRVAATRAPMARAATRVARDDAATRRADADADDDDDDDGDSPRRRRDARTTATPRRTTRRRETARTMLAIAAIATMATTWTTARDGAGKGRGAARASTRRALDDARATRGIATRAVRSGGTGEVGEASRAAVEGSAVETVETVEADLDLGSAAANATTATRAEASADLARGAASGAWRSDVVPEVAYVVTWCCGNSVAHLTKRFDGLAATTLGLVFAAKTPESACDALTDDLRAMTWMCAEMPNSQAREVDAMAWFLRETYVGDAPKIFIFAHDDRPFWPSLRAFVEELRTGERDGTVTRVVDARARKMEKEFSVARDGKAPTDFDGDTFIAYSVAREPLVGTYMYTNAFALLLRTFFDVVKDVEDPASELADAPDRNASERPGWRVSSRYLGERLDWPISAIFAVTRDMAKHRSQKFYEALSLLVACDGKLTSAVDFEYFAALEWAHTLERAWLPIVFNPALRERAEGVPECLLDAEARCYEVLDWNAGVRDVVRYDPARHADVPWSFPQGADSRGLSVATEPRDVVDKCGARTWHDHPIAMGGGKNLEI